MYLCAYAYIYKYIYVYIYIIIHIHTVDGRSPAPVDRWFIPLFIGFQPSKVVQDFATIHSITYIYIIVYIYSYIYNYIYNYIYICIKKILIIYIIQVLQCLIIHTLRSFKHPPRCQEQLSGLRSLERRLLRSGFAD